jgi:L-ascorbate metabolism protein UlaG (beta-lactamase superfamily)
MKIKYLGHACLSITINDTHLIIDPFITGNELAKNIDINSLKADYILITHAHQDHILDVEYIAKNTGATLISNYEIITHFEQKGLQGHPMNHGGSWDFDFGRISYTNAVHSSSFPDGSYGGQPGGFIIEANDKAIYIAGDTALSMDMQLIPMQCKLDLAILPVGDNFTMGVQSAAIAADFVACDEILAYHFDTFGYIKINHQKAKDYFLTKGKNLHILPIGKSLTI